MQQQRAKESRSLDDRSPEKSTRRGTAQQAGSPANVVSPMRKAAAIEESIGVNELSNQHLPMQLSSIHGAIEAMVFSRTRPARC